MLNKNRTFSCSDFPFLGLNGDKPFPVAACLADSAYRPPVTVCKVSGPGAGVGVGTLLASGSSSTLDFGSWSYPG